MAGMQKRWMFVLTVMSMLAIALAACTSAENENAGDPTSPIPEHDVTESTSNGTPENSAEPGDSITVDAVQYDLIACHLHAKLSGELVAQLAIGLQGNCYFVRERSGEPQTYMAESGLTTLVMTSIPHEDDKFCDTRIRAVRLDPGNLQVSEEEQRIQSCSRGPHDDKLLVILSDSVPRD